jgi:putative acetyltransferase
MSDYSLRPYQPDDFESVVRLWHRSWHQAFPGFEHPWSYEQWRAHFQEKVAANERIWIAESASQIAGFLVLRESDGYLDQIFVAPEIQRQGVGTILLNKAKQLAPNGIYLTTLQRNTSACLFYEQHGFVAERTGINSNNGQPNIEYRWRPQAARMS